MKARCKKKYRALDKQRKGKPSQSVWRWLLLYVMGQLDNLIDDDEDFAGITPAPPIPLGMGSI